MVSTVVLSPHLDDAVLSCWARLVTGVREVVTVHAGIPGDDAPSGGWDRLTGATHGATRMRQRRREDTEALRLAGCRPRHLDHLDGQYRRRAPDLARMRAELQEATREAGQVWLPAGLGAHPDHVRTRDIGLEVAGPAASCVLYAELPYAVQYGWPGWVTGRPDDPRVDVAGWWAVLLANAGFPEDRLRATVHRLDRTQVAAKRTALARYATQFPALAAGFGGRLGDPRVLAYEVSWTVLRPAGVAG